MNPLLEDHADFLTKLVQICALVMSDGAVDGERLPSHA